MGWMATWLAGHPSHDLCVQGNGALLNGYLEAQNLLVQQELSV